MARSWPVTRRQFNPSTRITDQAMRRVIHDQGVRQARFNAERNRRKYASQRSSRRPGLNLTLAYR